MTTSLNFQLTGQRALVTAGAQGIGLAITEALLQQGAEVHICDVDRAALDKTKAQYPQVHISHTDVGNEAQVLSMFAEIQKRWGQLDILVNNAGIAGPTAAIEDTSLNEWQQTLDVNLTGAFLCTRSAVPLIKKAKGGSIINISSVLGLRPTAMAPHYSTAKAGIIALTKSQSQELAPLGVRVNAVCPGYIDTPLLAPMNELMKVAIVSQIGIGRLGTDDEIAEMVSYIASAKASYCTGEVFSVTGGYSG